MIRCVTVEIEACMIVASKNSMSFDTFSETQYVLRSNVHIALIPRLRYMLLCVTKTSHIVTSYC